MDEAKRELIHAWLRRAYDDLLSARRLGQEPGAILGPALYHYQQAAEKAIKAVLVYHDKPFDKTHDVGVLLKLVLPFHSAFSPTSGAANRLSRYAIVYRYPSEEPEPEREQFDAALRDVEDLFALVLQRLPVSTHL